MRKILLAAALLFAVFVSDAAPPLGIVASPASAQNLSTQCTGGMVGAWPNCRCLAGMVLAEIKTSAGTTRRCVAAQPGQASTCPPDRPGGTYPNCCPAGQVYFFRECRTPPQQCSPGMIGAAPNCQCPPGTVYRRTFSKTASRCVAG